MRRIATWIRLGAGLSLLFGAGCHSTDSGSNSGGSAYYGSGLTDPWYYGAYGDDVDVIVTPPPGNATPPPRPEHPIALPPTPRPMPLPTIPSTPRPALRR